MITKSKSSPSHKGELFTTYEEAHAANAYTLAARWADVVARPVRVPRAAAIESGIPVREVKHELDELATMSALRYWLDAWLPLSIHDALLAGASVEEIALATGHGFDDVVAMWRKWSARQRDAWSQFPEGTEFDEDRSGHDRVAELLRSSLEDRDCASPAGNLRMKCEV